MYRLGYAKGMWNSTGFCELIIPIQIPTATLNSPNFLPTKNHNHIVPKYLRDVT